MSDLVCRDGEIGCGPDGSPGVDLHKSSASRRAPRGLDGRPVSAATVSQKGRKQHEQVGDGEYKEAMSSAPISLAAPIQLDRQRNENRSADNSGCAIDCAGKPERPRERRNG